MAVSSAAAPVAFANALQESITAVVWLRARRQPVTDAAAFRARLTQLLARAEQEAIAAGFTPQDARLGIFAVVALLDESVLNAGIPELAEWARRPLQAEMFGALMAGEWFFDHVEQLLARPDSPQLTELLEIYQLCLLLGFRGKYGADDRGALHAVKSRLAERLARMRAFSGDLAPAWRPPADRVDSKDPWLRPLTMAVLGSALLLVVVWGLFALALRQTRDEVRTFAPVASAAGSNR